MQGQNNSLISASQIRKYNIGDKLESEDDIMRDTHDVKLLLIDVFDYVFVRRSGGQWTYAIVLERTENEVVFVLDKCGSKKRIQRNNLLANVRRLKYVECFKGSARNVVNR